MTDPNVPATQAEPEPTAEVVQQQSEDDTQAHDDSSQGDGGEPQGGEPDPTPEQRQIAKLLKRIDKLTAQKGDVTRAAQQEIDALRAQINKAGGEEGGTEEPLDAETVDRLVTDRAKQMRQQEAFAERVQAVLRDGKKIEGFDAATNALSREIPFTDQRGRPTPFLRAVLSSDMPAEVIAYLGENDDEAETYSGLSEVEIGRRLARLEDKLKRSAIAKKSAAPTPLKSVKGATTVSVDESAMTDRQWAAARLKAKLAR